MSQPPGPRLVTHTPHGKRREQPNAGFKNLLVLHAGMGYPRGAVVPKTVFPNGGADHLKLGAVTQTNNPATHGVAVARAAATDAAPTPGDVLHPGKAWDPVAQAWSAKPAPVAAPTPPPTPAPDRQVAELRLLVATLEGQLHDAKRGVADRDGVIETLKAQLAEANDLYRMASEALEAQTHADVQAGFAAPPAPRPAAAPAAPPAPPAVVVPSMGRDLPGDKSVQAPVGPVPVMAAPWGADVVSGE